MAVREYGASAYVQGGIGTAGLATVAQGAFTVVAVAKVLSQTDDGALLDLSNAGVSRALFGYTSGGAMRYLRGSFEEAGGGPSWTTSDGWVLVAWTKASGTTTVRFHKCVLSSDTWTHQNSSGNVQNDDNTCTFWSQRPNNDSDFVFRGRVAAVAVFSSVLNDAAIEALRDDYADWLAAAPIDAWSHGQLSTATAITDDAGDADQTTLVGSSVVFGDDPPGFVGFTSDPTFPFKVADRGSAQNLTSSTSTAVDLPTGASIDVANNVLVARWAGDNSGTNGAATTVSISDPRGNTWTVGTAANQDPGAANAGMSCRIAYCVPTTPYQNGDDVTFNYGNNTAADAVVIEEWANIDRTTPVAVAQTTATGASGTPSISRSPGAADQLVYCALGIEGPAGDTYTQDADTTNGTWTGLTSLSTGSGTAASNATIRGAYKVVTASGAQTWNPTITSRDWAAVGLVFQVAPSTVTVEPDDATHGHAAEQPAITQLHQLSAADAGHGHTADQPAVTQVHALQPDSATHGHTADATTVDQAHVVTPADAVHAHIADQATLSQAHQVAAADALHAHTADAAALAQTHQVEPADAGHGHSADQPAITQLHLLVPGDAQHGHTAEQPVIVVGAVNIDVDSASHTHQVDAPSLSQTHVIAAGDALHGHAVDLPTLTQLHQLAAADAVHTHSADHVAIGGGFTVDPAPPDQTYMVPAELRLTAVAAEARIHQVAATVRLSTVAAEDRTALVPAESRLVVVSTEDRTVEVGA